MCLGELLLQREVWGVLEQTGESTGGEVELGQHVYQKCGGSIFPGSQTAAESTQVPGLSELLFQSHQDQSKFLGNYVIDDITS